MKLSKVVRRIEAKFPQQWAEEWDISGLLVGDPWAEVQFILLALEPSPAVIEEAKSKGANLIITHHPPDLSPPKRAVEGDPLGHAYYATARAGIALYAMHTVLDVSPISSSVALASQLELLDAKTLVPTDKGKYFKLVVFVPEGYVEPVRKALNENGAGNIGKYSDCSFSSVGEGTFLPGQDAKPFSGLLGHLKKAKEHRLETIVPVERLDAAIGAMIRSHPYEEVAYDLYPLANAPGRLGYGQVGDLPRPMSLLEFAQNIKGLLPSGGIVVCGKSEKRISRIAVVGGAGDSFIDEAIAAGADLLLTGEAKYHRLRYAEARGISVISAGHFATEWVALPALKAELDSIIWEHAGDGVIDIAQAEHSPYWIA
ncbi:Nif3-like dinuclear metal center hexameric protein [bacterium]|nr:Nif3-like dinuclear metal center hexameric protein [bacterium]